MADSQTEELLWRETYFIMFPQYSRPMLDQVEHVLSDANGRITLKNLAADEDGAFQSLLVESAEDHAAVEVSYEVGEAVVEQNLAWLKEFKEVLTPDQQQLLLVADARIDVAHYERRTASATMPAEPRVTSRKSEKSLDLDDAFSDDAYADFADDDLDDPTMGMLDPTCLLTVVEALAGLTDGLTIDPASGEVL